MKGKVYKIMMRSLSSAVGGLRSHQIKMDVIGNNIANVNTYGFKSSRTTFSDVYYQTTSGGAGSNNPVSGGVNPTQIGYGASVATIDVLNQSSGMASTERALDLYINGDGMLSVKDGDGNLFYSRLGVLGFDAKGFLVDSNGNFVMGFPNATNQPIVNSDGTVDADSLSYIQVPTEMLDTMTNISIGSTGEIIGTMPGDTTGKIALGLPKWITDLKISDKSDLSGNIKLDLDIIPSTDDSLTSQAPWFVGIEGVKNTGLAGTYSFAYDRLSNTLSATETTTGTTYTGTYVRGDTFSLLDSAGNKMMNITTDQYIDPAVTSPSPAGTITFSAQKTFTLKASDAGGNLIEEKLVWDGLSTPITFGTGSTQVTVNLDPSAVERINKTQLEAKSTFPDYSSIISGTPFILSDSNMLSGDVNIKMGIDYISSPAGGTGANNILNVFDQDKINDMLSDYANAVNLDASLGKNATIEIKENGTDGILDVLVKVDGTTVASVLGWDCSLNGNMELAAQGWSAGAAAPYEILSAGSGYNPFVDTSSANENSGKINLATIGQKNKVSLLNSTGDIIAQTNYTSGDTLTLGDITIPVDKNEIAKYFKDLTNSLRNAPQNSFGTISYENVPQWKYSGTIGAATPSEGAAHIIGVLSLAKFANVAGMNQAGKSYFTQSANSGEPTFARPGSNSLGSTLAGYLEMSNVDISKEFTDMITTQRGFQANTRIITVSDQMLEELVNLKR